MASLLVTERPDSFNAAVVKVARGVFAQGLKEQCEGLLDPDISGLGLRPERAVWRLFLGADLMRCVNGP
ncbi:MAG: hypothetical protein WDM89_01865 [Rhizomicrobium sp.]